MTTGSKDGRARRAGAGAHVAGLLAAAVLMWPSHASAQRLSFAITPQLVTFPSADPDLVPVIDAAPVQATVKVAGPAAPWTMTVLALGDLTAGRATVGISNVSWTGSPASLFRSGTLNKLVAQVVASGTGRLTPPETGLLTFHFKNSWTYSTGTYTQSIVFTVTQP
jgi:hypothetical protein